MASPKADTTTKVVGCGSRQATVNTTVKTTVNTTVTNPYGSLMNSCSRSWLFPWRTSCQIWASQGHWQQTLSQYISTCARGASKVPDSVEWEQQMCSRQLSRCFMMCLRKLVQCGRHTWLIPLHLRRFRSRRFRILASASSP